MCQVTFVSFSLLGTCPQLQDFPPEDGFLEMLFQVWDFLLSPNPIGSLAVRTHFPPRSPFCIDDFWKLAWASLGLCLGCLRGAPAGGRREEGRRSLCWSSLLPRDRVPLVTARSLFLPTPSTVSVPLSHPLPAATQTSRGEPLKPFH